MDASDRSQVLFGRVPKPLPCPFCKSIFVNVLSVSHYHCPACKYTYESPKPMEGKEKGKETTDIGESSHDGFITLPSQLTGVKDGAVSSGPRNAVSFPHCNSTATEPSTAATEKEKGKEKAHELFTAIEGNKGCSPVKGADLSNLIWKLQSMVEKGSDPGSDTDSEPPSDTDSEPPSDPPSPAAFPLGHISDECGIPVIPNPAIRPQVGLQMLPDLPMQEDHQSEVPLVLQRALQEVGFDCDSGKVVLVSRCNNKGGGTLQLKLWNLLNNFHLRLDDAVEKLEVSKTPLKKACREFGIKRWPGRKMRSLIRKAAESNVDAMDLADEELVKEIRKLTEQSH